MGTTVGDGAGRGSMVEHAFAEAIATQGVVAGTSDYARCMALVSRGPGEVREIAVASGTEHGVAAGRRAAARIIAGVLTGPHTAARMRLAGATHLIDSIAGLPDLVASSG